jgi:hypothetical protein
MDLTPAFFDRWREHRDLDYVDRVREIFEQAIFDDSWLEQARLRALAREARATLGHAGIAVEEEAVKAVADRGETDGLGDAEAAAVRAYVEAHRAAVAAAGQQAQVTPALLDDLHARLCAGVGTAAEGSAETDDALRRLCDWLAAPPDELHPLVTAALAHVELLRLRRWADGNARSARLLMLFLVYRDGYDYRALLSPSTEWSDPRRLPERPTQELSPDQAETHPAVEHTVHCVAQSVRDMVSWVRAEEGAGSVQAMAFGFPLQP